MSRPTRPTPSLVVAVLALFVALGGTGYAAATLSGKSLVKRSVPADRIMLNALTGTQINESRLGQVPSAVNAANAVNAKLAETAVAAQTAETAKTAEKAKDADTLQGRPASAFQSNEVRVVLGQVGPFPGPAGGYPATATALCAATEKAISGGGGWFIPGQEEQTALDAPVTASTPVLGPEQQISGWRTSGRNFSGTDRVLRSYALCVPKTVA